MPDDRVRDLHRGDSSSDDEDGVSSRKRPGGTGPSRSRSISSVSAGTRSDERGSKASKAQRRDRYDERRRSINFNSLLAEAKKATEGISERDDYTALQYDLCVVCPEESVAAKSVLIVDSGAAFSTVPSSDHLVDVEDLERSIHLEYADGTKGTRIIQKGSLLLNGKQVRALISPDLQDCLLSTSQLDT